MTHAIISLMCCAVFHCFKYGYILNMLTISNLKYSKSFKLTITILLVQVHEC